MYFFPQARQPLLVRALWLSGCALPFFRVVCVRVGALVWVFVGFRRLPLLLLGRREVPSHILLLRRSCTRACEGLQALLWFSGFVLLAHPSPYFRRVHSQSRNAPSLW